MLFLPGILSGAEWTAASVTLVKCVVVHLAESQALSKIAAINSGGGIKP